MNIKHISLVILIALLALSHIGCKKDESITYAVEQVFKGDEEAIEFFKSNFIDGQSAWKAVLSPRIDGKAYGFYITMTEKGEVNMLSDLHPESGYMVTGSTFELKAKAGNAVLNFSKGSYFDLLYVQQGRKKIAADTSYTVRYASADTLVLLGNQYGDELKMVKASVQERNAYTEAGFTYAMLNTLEYLQSKLFHSVLLGPGKAVQIMIDQNDRSAIAYYVANNRLVTTASYISYGINEINFKTPLMIEGKAVHKIFIDPTKPSLYWMDGNNRIDFIGANIPVIPLHHLLGHGLPNVISAPNPFTYYDLDGWSDAAYLAWYKATLSLYNGSGASFMLGDFEFIEEWQQMNITVHFQIGNSAFRGIFPFRYTKTATGVYRFERLELNIEDPQQRNAAIIESAITDFLDLFESTSYKLDYYESDWLLGQFIGVDNPDIYFTGFFGSLANQ